MENMKECTNCHAQILNTDEVCPFCNAAQPVQATTVAPTRPAPPAVQRARPLFPDRILMALGTMIPIQFVSTVISVVIFVILGNSDGHWIGLGIEALGVLAGMVLTTVLLARIVIHGVLNLGWVFAIGFAALCLGILIVALATVLEGSSMFAGITVLVVLNFVGWQIAAFIAAVRWFK